MNIYPSWKNWLVVIVVGLGIFFALPNMFGEDPAVQFQAKDTDVELTQAQISNVEATLKDAGIKFESSELVDGKLLIRFADSETQLKASEELKGEFESGFTSALSYAPKTPKWMQNLNMGQVGLGLDLRGGVHLLFEVDLESYIKTDFEKYEGQVRSQLRKIKPKSVRPSSIKVNDDSINIIFKNEDDRSIARKDLTKGANLLYTYTDVETQGGPSISVTLSEAQLIERQNFAIEQNSTTLRNRVNELGVSEPLVQRQGLDRIVVQLPGVQNPNEAIEILGSTATIEFRMQDEENNAFQAAQRGRAPLGSKLFYDAEGTPYLLKRQVIASGEHLSGAKSGIDTESGTPAVFVNLSGQGAVNMLETTKANRGKRMASVFISQEKQFFKDGERLEKPITTIKKEVVQVATIQGVFSNSFQITGLDSVSEAGKIALILRSGALAAPLYIVEERTIGPTLGADNIKRGLKAILIGFASVFFFMFFYYRRFGFYANLALLANLILIVGLLSLLPTSLTLPGIAGIILTVGMAVDANVLIFERIREELDVGSTPQSAIHSGYAKAFSSIADANVTTLIAALVLFTFGTGPVRGFAVTLSLGIMTSMFTAIVGTRALVNKLYGTKQDLETLSI